MFGIIAYYLKLKSVGLNDSLLEWFQNYLSDCKQRVVLHVTGVFQSGKAEMPSYPNALFRAALIPYLYL